jgi:hypothetical protein
MPAAPFSTVGGYGGSASLQIQPSGSAAGFTSDLDGFPVLVGSIAPATGALSAIQIDASTISSAGGMPAMNAILIELRVIAALLHTQLGATQLDLEQMRADEGYSQNPATGVL